MAESPDLSDPLRLCDSLSALARLRQQNTLLVTEYSTLKSQIAQAVAKVEWEGRKLSRAGVDTHPDLESQRRLLENSKRQCDFYAREHSMLKRRLDSRCTLDAVIDLEDAVSELQHRLQEAEFENRLLRRQQRIMDKEEKTAPDPVAEIAHGERQVEMYVRRIRDLEERSEANIDLLQKSEKRLQEAERAQKSLDSLKKELFKPQPALQVPATQSRAEVDALRLRLQRIETDRQAAELRLKQRISDLETELRKLTAFQDFARRQNSAKDAVRYRQESKLLQLKLAEIESLREIKDRRGKEMQSSRANNSSSPLGRRPSQRSLTPVL